VCIAAERLRRWLRREHVVGRGVRPAADELAAVDDSADDRSDSNADADSESDSDANSGSHANTRPHANSGPDTDAESDTYARPDTHARPDSHAEPDPYAEPHTDAESYVGSADHHAAAREPVRASRHGRDVQCLCHRHRATLISVAQKRIGHQRRDISKLYHSVADDRRRR
jgi:hypothetical protein